MKRKIFFYFFLIANVTLSFAVDINVARELLMVEKGGGIIFLSKINLGIPGGENWIANRSDKITYFYTINDEKEVRVIDGISIVELSDVKYWDSNTRLYINFEYNIMQGIPGTCLGSKAAKFGDYDSDGIDEIFDISPFNESHCRIFKYDNDEDKIIFPFRYRFDFISPKEPAPVIFANYQRKGNGILIHLKNHSEERYIWRFFMLNEKSLKHREYMEISADEIDFSQFTIFKAEENEKEKLEETYQPVLETQKTDDFAEADEFAETHAVQKAAFTTGLGFYIGIGGIFVIAAAAVFVLIRKKKKNI